MILLNFDKSGAEWFVVAHIANDPNMLSVEQRGVSPHLVTGNLMSRAPEALILREHKLIGETTDANRIHELRKQHLPELLDGGYYLPRTMSIRQMGKKSNHGLNYDEGFKTFALVNEIAEKEAKHQIDLYHSGYPGIRKIFHQGVQDQLGKDRTLTNSFGRRCWFQEAWGPDLFKQGYAFLPQSTVGDSVNEALLRANDDEDFFRWHWLAQVHDSVVAQADNSDWLALARQCIKFGLDYLCPELNYNGPFKIKTDLKVGRSWGKMVEVKLTDDATALAAALESAWAGLHRDSGKPRPDSR